MVGHSKWSKVKHIKGLLDVKRDAAFSKPVKEITVAARIGGGDLSGSPRLPPVVETTRDRNMPKESSERAIKKGTGELEGVNHNHKNRAANFRFIFSKNHGSPAAVGNVLYMCHQKGVLTAPRPLSEEDWILNA